VAIVNNFGPIRAPEAIEAPGWGAQEKASLDRRHAR
jgi:hypothetical protein